MNKPINETTVKEWFLNKQKEIDASVPSVENTTCIWCGNEIKPTELIHKDCKEALENWNYEYANKIAITCSCGHTLLNNAYRCPICYKMPKNPVSIIKINNTEKIINDIIVDAREYVDDYIESSFVSDFRFDVFNGGYKAFNTYRDNLGIENTMEDLYKSEATITEDKNDIDKRVAELEKVVATPPPPPPVGDEYGKILVYVMIALLGLIFVVASIMVTMLWEIICICLIKNSIDNAKALKVPDTSSERRLEELKGKQRELATALNNVKTKLKTLQDGVHNDYEAIRKTSIQMKDNFNIDKIVASKTASYREPYASFIKSTTASLELANTATLTDTITKYFNNEIDVDTLTNKINETYNFLPRIELDRFINYIRNTPTHFITKDNILNPLRYYIRFIDIINGTKSPNETKAVRKFQNAFFNNLNMTELVNNEKLAIRKLKATIPAEIEFKGTNEYENGYTAEPAEHYVINTMMNTYCNAYYDDKYDKNDLNEFFNYMYIVIADYIATIEQLEIERIETKERIKEAHRLQEIEDQREHELEVAEINARAMRYQADTESALARQYEAKARQREADNDERLQTMINENNALRKDLNNSNNAINSMAKDISELKKKSNESVFNSPNKRLEIWEAGQIFRGEKK